MFFYFLKIVNMLAFPGVWESTMAPNVPKRAPRRRKGAPKGLQDGAQEDPKTVQEGLKTPQEAPKTTQEGIKTAQEAPKMAQESPKTPQEDSKRTSKRLTTCTNQTYSFNA